MIADAVEAAKQADIVIFIGGLNKSEHQDSEGTDREDFALPYNQDRVIEALVEANSNTVVVALTGNAYAMPWLSKVPAVVQGWYIGSEAGNAIADVIFGDVNPSGKLPFTFAKSLADYAPHAAADSLMYPGVDGNVVYKEGLNIGYRYTDKLRADRVNFAFGHGLSYTEFRLGKPVASARQFNGQGTIEVTVAVTNIGDRSGAEVVQAYVSDAKCSVERPIKEPKAFQKVTVAPGQTQNATLSFDRRAFAFYNPTTKLWTIEPGKFEILIGTASNRITAKIPVEVKEEITWKD